ncbi:GlsB/YeaQ/YmgE family stress response membrane protein [Apibacter sp. HY039]|uniref:GlsB/YeaQ/YmgE family stress response membrane protein n=1 Tax=Apibacter sp. HY039 TaxID=2501476 RepID=UPI000FEC17C7|nr:GlsB/YeaQ/YmgE family stress response membrane protein [Apibacter sp. HY039]
MEGLGFIWSVIIGVIAGALAGWIMKGRGFGFLVNLLVGLVGSMLGGWIYSLLGIQSDGKFGILVMSVLGAVVLLWIVSMLKRK